LNLVAASKLRRAQLAAEAARPYAERMSDLIGRPGGSRLAMHRPGPKLLSGTGRDQVHLVVVVTSERGLCGGFNTQIVRQARERVEALRAAGETVKILCAGRRGPAISLRRFYANLIVDTISFVTLRQIGFAQACRSKWPTACSACLMRAKFDVATLIYSRFRNVMSQVTNRVANDPGKVRSSRCRRVKGSAEHEP